MLRLIGNGECIYWKNDNEGFFFIQISNLQIMTV
jgi:hypothetical protein